MWRGESFLLKCLHVKRSHLVGRGRAKKLRSSEISSIFVVLQNENMDASIDVEGGRLFAELTL